MVPMTSLPGALSAAVLFTTVCGCTSFIPLTQTMRTSYQLAPQEVACLQYYISDTVVLERDVTGELVGVEGGELVRRGGRQIHVVRIPGHAPGRLIADFVADDVVGARFGAEQPTPILFTHEGWLTLRTTGPDRRDRYALQMNGREQGGTEFTVLYGGRPYSVASGREAYLMIRDDAIRTESTSSTELTGEHISDDVLTSDQLAGERPRDLTIDAVTDTCVATHTRFFEERAAQERAAAEARTRVEAERRAREESLAAERARALRAQQEQERADAERHRIEAERARALDSAARQAPRNLVIWIARDYNPAAARFAEMMGYYRTSGPSDGQTWPTTREPSAPELVAYSQDPRVVRAVYISARESSGLVTFHIQYSIHGCGSGERRFTLPTSVATVSESLAQRLVENARAAGMCVRE